MPLGDLDLINKDASFSTMYHGTVRNASFRTAGRLHRPTQAILNWFLVLQKTVAWQQGVEIAG